MMDISWLQLALRYVHVSRGHSHVISLLLSLLHVPPRNKAASSPLVPLLLSLLLLLLRIIFPFLIVFILLRSAHPILPFHLLFGEPFL